MIEAPKTPHQYDFDNMPLSVEQKMLATLVSIKELLAKHFDGDVGRPSSVTRLNVPKAPPFKSPGGITTVKDRK